MKSKAHTLAVRQEVKARNSSIELLKIIGIILIVISHVNQTLHCTNELVGVQDYVLDISNATTNIQYLILVILCSCGALGNTIFFVCSAWFLLDSDRVNKKKILQMLLDIWVVSIVILIIVYYLRDGDIGLNIIIKQIFPTTFANNWYMTCYLLFYPIHPFLNWIIRKMNQKTLLRSTLILSVLYIFIDYFYIFDDLFFTSLLILWVTIYFVIGYMKYYLVDVSNNIRINLVIFGIGFLGNCGIVLLADYIGLHIGVFSDSLLSWSSTRNPFVIMMVIGMLNIARNIHFESKIINYVSKLSMLIYIIHENVLLRKYYRPLMWQWVYTNVGYGHVVVWVFIISAIVFVFALIASIIYKNTIQKGVTKIVDLTYPLLCRGYVKFEKLLLKLH